MFPQWIRIGSGRSFYANYASQHDRRCRAYTYGDHDSCQSDSIYYANASQCHAYTYGDHDSCQPDSIYYANAKPQQHADPTAMEAARAMRCDNGSRDVIW